MIQECSIILPLTEYQELVEGKKKLNSKLERIENLHNLTHRELCNVSRLYIRERNKHNKATEHIKNLKQQVEKLQNTIMLYRERDDTSQEQIKEMQVMLDKYANKSQTITADKLDEIYKEAKENEKKRREEQFHKTVSEINKQIARNEVPGIDDEADRWRYVCSLIFGDIN